MACAEVSECPLCCEIYDDQNFLPHLLSCGHTFWSSCLENLLKNNSISCPECRRTASVPVGVVGLTKNYALLRIGKTTPQQTEGVYHCEACDTKHPATSWCLDCDDDICSLAARLPLAFTVVTRRVLTTKLFPWKSWLCPFSARNIMRNSAYLMKNVITWSVGVVLTWRIRITAFCLLLKVVQSVNKRWRHLQLKPALKQRRLKPQKLEWWMQVLTWKKHTKNSGQKFKANLKK